MITWRPAYSLTTLFRQLDVLFPDRDRASDGTICDPATHSPDSDHCPHDFPGWGNDIVTAGDYTHDPASGADMGEVSEMLRLSRDPRIKYVIHNRRIFSATNAPWEWRPYTLPNPHTRHMHLSVIGARLADDTREWSITVPLTNEDIKKVSDATAAKVLGKPWSILGRTLVGGVETLLNYHPIVMTTLREIRDDPDNTFDPTDAELQLVADRLATRLPQGGTFTLTPPAPPA